MIVTHNVTIDLLNKGYCPQIDAMQDDQYTRDLAISLMTGEVPWPIPEDASVVIRYSKIDGTGGEYDTLPDGTGAWAASENVLTLSLAPQVLTAPGTVVLSATLIREEQVLSIFSVHIHVRQRVGGIFMESAPYHNVMGFLPGPVNAEVGQFLRVAQTDDTGRVVALEGAAVSGGNGNGLSTTAINLLVEILKAAVFTANITGKLESLEQALLAGSSGDASGDGGGSGDSGDIDESGGDSGSSGEDSGGDSGESGGGTGSGETTTDDITVSNGIMTIVSVGSEITVSAGIMVIA